MAEFAALPLFTDSWVADTAHLTRAARGLYHDLLVLCWRTSGCKVPADLKWLSHKLSCSPDEVETLKLVIDEFMTRDGEKLFQRRLLKEWLYVKDRVEKRRESAKSRWKKETPPSERNPNGDDSHYERNAPTPTPTPTLTEEKESSPIGEPKKAVATATPPDQITGLFDGDEPARPEASPKPKRGRPPRDGPAARIPADWQVSETNWAWCRREGFNDGFTRQQAEGFRDHWLAADGPNARKRDWDAAFRTWMRRSRDNGRGLPPPAANGAGRPPGRATGPTGYATAAARVLHRRGEIH